MAHNLENWNPDDASEWESTGKTIATRNLWISIPSLLAGFAIWIMWSVITVQMLNVGYGGFEKSQLFTLAAIAGLFWRNTAHSVNLLYSPSWRQKHPLANHDAFDIAGLRLRHCTFKP